MKIKGNPKYLFVLMDDQTRLWIVQQVADTKYSANIQPLFKDAKEIAGKRPNTYTPAEKCGIIIEGQDNWKTVIENASKMSNQDD